MRALPGGDGEPRPSRGVSGDLVVVAVALDAPGQAAVARFLSRTPAPHVRIYLDPDPHLVSLRRPAGPDAISLWALPTTYVIDRHGGVQGYLTGPAQWDTPAARRLLEFFVTEGGPSPTGGASPGSN